MPTAPTNAGAGAFGPRSGAAGDARAQDAVHRRVVTRRRPSRAKRVKSFFTYATVIAWVAACLAPVVWVVLQSIKLPPEVFAIPPKWLFKPTLENYHDLFYETGAAFAQYLVNSLVVTIGTVALSLLVSLPAAYSLTFLPVRRRGFWMVLLLLAAMLPPVVLLVPLYLLWQDLNLLDNLLALILTYAALSVPFTIWLIRGFMVQIPREVFEAARVDGASHLYLLIRVILPLTRSGIAAASVFVVIWAWNELLYAVMLTTNHRTAPAGIVATLITDRGMEWGRLYAAATMVVLPIVVFTIAVQRHFVRGFTFGAVKG
jgi:ABC-type glycerol-3-phosphate transport system permease component